MNGPKYIVNHLYGSAEISLFNSSDRDNCTEPYLKLKKRFEELGYVCEGTKDQKLENCEWLMFWDASALGQWRYRIKAWLRGYPTRNLFKEAVRAGMKGRMALFMFEPPSVYPENYDFELHENFSVIFTWDPALVDGKKYHRIYLPSANDFPVVRPVPFSDRKLLVNISSQKFSSHPRELYGDIRRTIRFFEHHYPDQFDLYGFGWNISLAQFIKKKLVHPEMRREFYPSYLGIARSKSEVYPSYRFGLCYENTVDQAGYVSLKIFDCLRCGCVPVYFGAPDITDYVDKNAFVDRRAFGSIKEMGEYLSSVDEREYSRYVDAGYAYLQSSKFQLFLADNFVDTVISALGLSSNSYKAINSTVPDR